MTDLPSGYDPQRREAALARLAGRQHGVVSLAQLLNLSFSESFVKRAVRSGRLIRVHRGVYAVGHLNLGLRGRAKAAELATGGVISHISAAELLGIAREASGPIHVTVPQYRRDRPGLVLHRVVR
ncbi:MAG: hypothetical protein QOI80_3626 [Solirubrobacteraceae bacterium]|nr:hypothetical protein [Solirubrobacteraceae bacterium]